MSSVRCWLPQRAPGAGMAARSLCVCICVCMRLGEAPEERVLKRKSERGYAVEGSSRLPGIRLQPGWCPCSSWILYVYNFSPKTFSHAGTTAQGPSEADQLGLMPALIPNGQPYMSHAMGQWSPVACLHTTPPASLDLSLCLTWDPQKTGRISRRSQGPHQGP
jgi:hypothetical protein